MKRFFAGLHVICNVISVLIFVFLIIKTQNGHMSQNEITPYIIGFVVSGVISGLTKSALHHVSEEVYYKTQQDFMRIMEHQQMQDTLNQQMLNQQTIDMQNQLAIDNAMRAAEDARLAATGIEFGGYNPDPNLNPGMSSTMQDFGCNNSFGMF